MRVLIVNNLWVARLGLSHFLKSLDPATECEEAATLEEARKSLGGGKPFDVCLLDYQMEEGDPMTVLREVRQAADKTPILVVTSSGSRRRALEAIEQGASGFVLNSSTRDELARALQRVSEGDIWLPAGLRELPPGPPPGMAEGRAGFPVPKASPSLAVLTPRQRQVLELIATGKRNVDIAGTLGISPRTVQIHVSTILKLLKVSNRTEAALLAHGRQSEA